MGWLKEEGFGGIMIWSVDMDDFRGQCGTGKYPLINAMRQELEDYTVKLEYDGPFETSVPGAGAYTTKDRKQALCTVFINLDLRRLLKKENQIYFTK